MPPICSFSDTLCREERIWKTPQVGFLHENLMMEFSENVCSTVLGREPFLDPAAYGRPVGGARGGWKKCDFFLTVMHWLCQLEAEIARMGSGGEVEQEPLSMYMPAFRGSAQG